MLMILAPLGAAKAFECPKHFAEAQAVIDKVTEDMKGNMSKTMSKEDMALVHALLDDAKSWLASAMHNHEKPQGLYDHAQRRQDHQHLGWRLAQAVRRVRLKRCPCGRRVA